MPLPGVLRATRCASNFFAMPVIGSLIRSGTSWRDTPASAIGERTKCFRNAERKLHELMESWDYLLAEEITSGWEDHDYLSKFGRVASEGDTSDSVIIQCAHHTARYRCLGKNERHVFILNVETVDCVEGGITVAIRLQPT
jgi:hypothetical protein